MYDEKVNQPVSDESNTLTVTVTTEYMRTVLRESHVSAIRCQRLWSNGRRDIMNTVIV